MTYKNSVKKRKNNFRQIYLLKNYCFFVLEYKSKELIINIPKLHGKLNEVIKMVKEIHDVKHLEKSGVKVDEMIKNLSGKDGDIIRENFEKYEPIEGVLSELEEKAKGHLFVVFCADWCKDCKTNVAAFAKIVKLRPNINGVFFKGIKSAPKDPDIRWRVPPSPPEVNDFDLRKIPTIYIVDSNGKLVGEMLENPEHKPTLEEELVYILDNSQG